MFYTIQKGSRQKRALVYAVDAANLAHPKTGLSAKTAGATFAYVREGAGRAERFLPVEGQAGVYTEGGFTAVDSELLPGVYEVGLPDAIFEPGADAALVSLQFPGAVIEPIRISLVAYNPQDESRLGMTALGPEGRVNALRGAFPLLTAREKTLAEALESKK